MNRHLTLLGLFLFFLLSPSLAAAQPAQRDPIPERALVNAVEKGDREKVLALLKQGANIDKVWINDTPLETAIFQQNIEMVKLLLDKGAKIKSEDLSQAAHGAQGDKAKALEIVKLLIAKGADVRANGAQALARRGDRRQRRDGPTAVGKRRRPKWLKHSQANRVLMKVVPYDSIDSIQALLEAGADVKAVNDNQETVLMNAARTDYRAATMTRVSLLKLLIDRGSDVKARDKNGRTALHYAVAHIMTEGGGFISRPEVVRVLLDNGAEVNAQDNRGETALMEIVQAWHSPIEITQLLIERGADVNLGNSAGVTALMSAAEKGRSDLVQLLLEKGALLDAKDKLGQTAIVHAVESGQPEVVGLLANKGADLSLTPYKTEAELKGALHNFSLIRAVTYRQPEEVKKLLDRRRRSKLACRAAAVSRR